jgi:Glyoxalase-like domain
VVPGGRHPGRGTHNAIVRFGTDYIELISTYSQDEAMAAGGNSAVTARFLAEREGLLGYALATDDIDALAVRFRDTGLEAAGPFAMRRRRPDGRILGWRLLVPFGQSWLTPWPMFIQWDAPDAERLSWERPGHHANGITRVAGLALSVRDPDRIRDGFQRQLGLAFPEPAAADVDGVRIELVTGPDATDQPLELTLASDDLERVRSATGGALDAGAVRIPPSRLFGARIAVVGG